MSTNRIYDAVANAVRKATAGRSGRLEVLDIGAGRGELITLLGETMRIHARACDYHVDRFALKNVEITSVDLNCQSLPYQDQSFDVVCCSEVIEHLENYRALFRQVSKVLKPGGIFVVTTPNVVNLKSRIRYLFTGFASLFGPLPVKNLNRASTGGHITPVPYFYLAHALLDADFVGIEVSTDKLQTTSRILLVVLAPFLWLGWKRFIKLESERYKTLNAVNAPYIREYHSTVLMLGRTVVCASRRPL